MKTATIEYSTDGATWTALEDVPEYELGPSRMTKPDSEPGMFWVIVDYIMLAMIVVSGIVQIVRTVRGDPNQKDSEEL